METPPRTLGLPFDVWSSRRLSAYLAETTGVRIAPGWLRVLLHRQRFACGRPKHTLAQLQDPEEVAACEARLQAAGEKVRAQPARYELHYEDETHVDTNPYLDPRLAPRRPPAAPAGRGDEPAPDDLR